MRFYSLLTLAFTALLVSPQAQSLTCSQIFNGPVRSVIEPSVVKRMIDNGNYTEALREINHAFMLAARPYHELILTSMRAKTLFLMGDVEASVLTYRRVLQLDPNNIIAHTQLGRLLLLSGQPREALIYLEHAQRIEPRNPLIYRNRLIAHQALKDVSAIEALMVNMGGNGRLMNEIALLVIKGEHDKAAVALDNAPQTISFLRLKTQNYYSMGRMDLAYPALLKVVRLANRVDFFALTALYRIEKGDTPDRKFEPSPILQALIGQLSDGEFQFFLKIRNNDPWIFQVDLYGAVETSDIKNPFWSQRGLYSRPVDGQAVRELKK